MPLYNNQPIPVVQLDLQGNFIAEYPNIGDAAFKTKSTIDKIQKALTGACLRAGTYHFVYKEYYNPEKNYSYNWRKQKRKFLKS